MKETEKERDELLSSQKVGSSKLAEVGCQLVSFQGKAFFAGATPVLAFTKRICTGTSSYNTRKVRAQAEKGARLLADLNAEMVAAEAKLRAAEKEIKEVRILIL